MAASLRGTASVIELVIAEEHSPRPFERAIRRRGPARQLRPRRTAGATSFARMTGARAARLDAGVRYARADLQLANAPADRPGPSASSP